MRRTNLVPRLSLLAFFQDGGRSKGRPWCWLDLSRDKSPKILEIFITWFNFKMVVGTILEWLFRVFVWFPIDNPTHKSKIEADVEKILSHFACCSYIGTRLAQVESPIIHERKLMRTLNFPPESTGLFSCNHFQKIVCCIFKKVVPVFLI